MIRKSLLTFLLVLIGLIVVSFNVLLFTQAGLRTIIYAADWMLSGNLSVASVDGQLANSFVLEGVRYSGDEGDISLGHISISWQPSSLFHKEFNISSFGVKDVSLALKSQKESPEANTTYSSFIIPVTLKVKEGNVGNLSFRFDDEPEEKVSSILLRDFSAEENMIRVGNCAITSDMYHIAVKGQVQTTDSFPADLQVEYTVRLDSYNPVSGTGTLIGTLQEMEYTLHLNSPFTGRMEGSVVDVVGETSWTGVFSSDALLLPEINNSWPDVSLKGLRINGAGNLEDYKLQGQASGSYDVFQDITISVNVSGDSKRLELTNVHMKKDYTQLNIEGLLAWEDKFTWQVNIVGDDINPSLLDQRWPGKLDGEAAVSGYLEEGKLRTDVDLVRLDGELRDYPLQAGGKVIIDDHNLTTDQFHIQSGDSVLLLKGNIADQTDLEFSITSPNLETVWPDLSGSLEGEGYISGNKQAPEIHFDISGKNIEKEKVKIGSLAAQGAGTWREKGELNVSLSSGEIVIDGTEIDTATADIKGSFQDHQVEVGISAPGLSSHLNLSGGYFQDNWQGNILKATIQDDQVGEWSLQEKAPLTASTEKIDLGKICFVGKESSRICAKGNYMKDEWSADAEIQSLSLSLFQDMEDMFNEIGGQLSGTVSVKGRGSEFVSGKFDFTGDNVLFHNNVTEEYAQEVVLKNISMSADIEGQHLAFQLNGRMADGSSISADGVLDDFSVYPLHWKDSGITGNIVFNVVDLSPLGSISYNKVEPSGTLQGNMKILGKLSRPELNGNIHLDQGRLNFPEQGIAVENMVVSVDGQGDQLRLKLSGTSGGGTIKADGTLTLDSDRDVSLLMHISGDNAQVVNLPEIKLRISPELQLKIAEGKRNLQGQVLVTDALIAPRQLKNRGVSVSKDVVIVDAEQEKDTMLPVEADLTVIAGDKVKVRAFGLRGYINGKLHIIAESGKPVVFQGNLQVRDGTYSIYGRQLNIVRGDLTYHGSPPDNPGIGVQAENTTEGVTTGIEVSGFLQEPDVRFYSTPPMEEDEIIRRLLLNTTLVSSEDDEGFIDSVASDTGVDSIASAVQNVKNSLRIDDVKLETGKESEDLSLVIGTWMTPQLYISYGKNLLKESGSFNTKYMLGHGFFLETETGTTDSGVDLMYEIER